MKSLKSSPLIRMSLSIGLLLLLSACQVENGEGSSSNKENSLTVGYLSKYSPVGNNLKVSLTDAPHDDLAEVVVSIKEVILKVNGNKGNELSIAQNLGPIDLLTLQNGVMMGIADMQLPTGTKVNQIRLILEETGHYITYTDGSVCQLQTPSQQNSGLKIINPEFTIEEGQAYSMVIDFDAKKSIVFQGNGGCLLKPVLKWGGITTTPIDEVVGDGDTEGEEEVIEEPVVEEPVVEEPVVEEPVVEEPVVEEPVVEEPVVEEPVVVPPVVEEPVVVPPVVEEPVVVPPVVEEPVVVPPVVEEPVVVPPVVEEPVVESPVVEEPVVEPPVVEEPPIVEEPVQQPTEADMEMCFNVAFDLYDTSTWPADFVYEDYAHCY
ncbi:MAG: DUF4382 domain-containing protein [Bacteriovoracaceae bacterium]|nr:DUF4382 domain-containing protein [Bacteriovoracaceae bacterium]